MMEIKTAYCLVSIAPVRKAADDGAEIVTQLLFGELVEVHDFNHPWAKIRTFSDGYEGYIDHKHISYLTDKEARRWSQGLSFLKDREAVLSTPWGKQRISRGSFVPENETSFSIGQDQFSLERPDSGLETILDYAEDYLNTPYLWGGKSSFGIDCSGLTQVIYRLFGWNLPRDCFEQINHGQEIAFEDLQMGDLAYFKNKSGKVTHVGILDGKGGIIHASGHVRRDDFTSEGIFRRDIESLTHPLFIIKRLS
ncbi:MAG: NlpC/P60 family protein [Crocinitomicaceae bacterium]